MPRVTTKAFIRALTTMNPLMKPRQPASTSAPANANGAGMPYWFMSVTVNHDDSPSTAPTDRSKWPPIIRSVMPIATIPSSEATDMIETNVSVVRKIGLPIEKMTVSRMNATRAAGSGRSSSLRARSPASTPRRGWAPVADVIAQSPCRVDQSSVIAILGNPGEEGICPPIPGVPCVFERYAVGRFSVGSGPTCTDLVRVP